MADPAIVSITPKETWVKVATNVTSGRVVIKNSDGMPYFYTYKETGNPAPADMSLANDFYDEVEFSHSTGIDIYIYAKAAVGSVEVQV